MTDIERSIFYTIVWFDIFNYPLTEWEVFRFQIQGISFEFEKIQRTLKESEKLKELISHKDGFYFLRWRDDLVKERKERYLIAEKKYKKLFKIVKILAAIPFVRTIAVATGLSYSNSKEEDDMDLFVIAQKNKIWTVRFFSVLILKIFRARPTLKSKRDKICLNFFIDQSAANLENISLPRDNDLPDIYFIYWLAWLFPIFQQDGSWQNFISQNSWLKKYLPFCFVQQPAQRRSVYLNGVSKLLKIILENFFLPDFWEKAFRFWQMKIMPRQLRELANKSSGVIINERMLKFHDKDRRQEYRHKFYEKTKQ